MQPRMAETQAEQVINKIKQQIPPDGIEKCACVLRDFRLLVDSSFWSDLIECGEDFAIMLNDLVDQCISTLGIELLEIITTAIEKYLKMVEFPELTSLHVALASLCRRHHYYSKDNIKHLHLFKSQSIELFPPLGIETDVSQYFEDCSYILAQTGDWDDAAVHAALAYSLAPSVERFRLWNLAELIAKGSVSDLPRAVWSNVSCSVISEFRGLFDDKSRKNWPAVVSFYEDHKHNFDSWGISQMVQRSLATYCVQCIDITMRRISQAPVNIVLEPFIGAGISLNELMIAGLERFCSIEGDLIVPKFVDMHSEASSASASQLLHEVANLSSSLQKVI